jgi:hypothetical protein
MTGQAAQASTERACWMLRLPAIRGNFFDFADVAAWEQMSCLGFVSELLLAPPRCPACFYAEGNCNLEL